MSLPVKYLLPCMLLLLLAGCDSDKPAQQAGQQPKPPAEVTVVVASAKTVPLESEFVGRLASTRVAEVRARVAGIILERLYTEGADVEKGQVLFQIDPAPLKATLHASEAALARAKANAANASLIVERYRPLQSRGVVSKQDFDNALATERETAAQVKQEMANVEMARLDLGYATVTAPISGYAGRALVTEGALVGEGEATRLTTIEQVDPIYVNFSQPVNDVQQIRQRIIENRTTAASGNTVRVTVKLPDGTEYPHPGSLDFSDVSVVPETATVSLRATVPNPDRVLLPGMFVRLTLTTGVQENAFVLPQSAVLRDAGGGYVFVVSKEGEVEQRRVETQGMLGSDWIVTGGLADGDQVITAGLQKVRPGSKAKAVVAGPPSQAQPGAKH
jgi:membrane fusion protein (multidrug efflux system)